MAVDQDKKNLQGVIISFVVLFVILLAIDWWYVCGFGIQENPDGPFRFIWNTISDRIHQGYYIFRSLYAVTVIIFCFHQRGISEDNSNRIYYVTSAILLTVFMIVGYSADWYNIFIYPVIFISHFVITAKAVSYLRSPIKDEELFKGVNKKKSNASFLLPTTDFGDLSIYKPEQHVWIDGGPGSGKSQSIFKPIIRQAAIMGLPGVIYDYEGDPAVINTDPEKDSNPILTNVAYTATLERANRDGYKDIKTKTAFLNFTDLSRTTRTNIFSKRYFETGGRINIGIADLYFGSLAEILLKNLNKQFKDHQDFWFDTALMLTKSVFIRQYKDEKCQMNGFNTLPHAIAMFLSDTDALFRWLSEDEDVKMLASAILTPWRNKSMGQLSGTVSTLQSAFSKLYNPNIFWVMSKDEFNLDVTNKENPVLLCLGSPSQTMREAVSPVLAMILSCVMKQMNSGGKMRSIFCIDEAPTVVLSGIDEFMATVRKHSVSVILGVQDFDQMVRDYGEKSAPIIRSMCGNHFYGMTGSGKNAEYVSKMFGEIKKKNISVSTNRESDSETVSENLQKDRVLQPRDISGQQVGEFVGKIVNGDPVFFKCRFEEFKYKTRQIPRFSLPVDVQDEAFAIKVLDTKVQANFEQIKKDVHHILSSYEGGVEVV